MPAGTTINLLDQPEFESSSIGKLLTWAITYGRYIMIGTEIIVLLAFISRFSLDRRLTDLREEISQKQIILQANQQFESDFIRLQKSLTKVQGLLNVQSQPYDLFTQVTSLLPADVFLTTFDVNEKVMELEFTAQTTQGLATFLGGLQSQKNISNIEVNAVEKSFVLGTNVRLRAIIQ